MSSDDIIHVIINPVSRINYSSFYLLGLNKMFKKKILYSSLPFNDIIEDAFKQCLTFIIVKKNISYNIAIDFHDAPIIQSKKTLEWCNIYAKINLNNKETFQDLLYYYKDSILVENYRKRILSISPSFGVRHLSLFKLGIYVTKVSFDKNVSLVLKKEVILSLIRGYVKRAKLENYINSSENESNNKYVFFISSIWNTDSKRTNIIRANFIIACKRIKEIIFDGGLVDIGYPIDYIPDKESVKINKQKIGIKSYIEKSKKSLVVFNIPSVQNCHGWKLAEYLAMGKAIISTKLSNSLPNELINHKHLYILDSENPTTSDLEVALNELINNKEKRLLLENNAKKWWKENGTPDAVLESIINQLHE